METISASKAQIILIHAKNYLLHQPISKGKFEAMIVIDDAILKFNELPHNTTPEWQPVTYRLGR